MILTKLATTTLGFTETDGGLMTGVEIEPDLDPFMNIGDSWENRLTLYHDFADVNIVRIRTLRTNSYGWPKVQYCNAVTGHLPLSYSVSSYYIPRY